MKTITHITFKKITHLLKHFILTYKNQKGKIVIKTEILNKILLKKVRIFL